MSEPITKSEPRARTFSLSAFVHKGAMQRLLAFGGLVILFVGFSLADRKSVV